MRAFSLETPLIIHFALPVFVLNGSVSFANSHRRIGFLRLERRGRAAGNLSSTPLSVASDISLLPPLLRTPSLPLLPTLISEEISFRFPRVSIPIYRLLFMQFLRRVGEEEARTRMNGKVKNWYIFKREKNIPSVFYYF